MKRSALEILSDLGGQFTFGDRPIPIPHDMRTDYRISLLLLMLHFCGWKQQAPLAKLHVLNWSFRTRDSRRSLLDRLNGKLHLGDVPLKFDPAFNRAIELARGEMLIERTSSDSLSLRSPGIECVNEILADPTCLVKEKIFFEAVGKKLTNALLKAILNPSSVW